MEKTNTIQPYLSQVKFFLIPVFSLFVFEYGAVYAMREQLGTLSVGYAWLVDKMTLMTYNVTVSLTNVAPRGDDYIGAIDALTVCIWLGVSAVIIFTMLFYAIDYDKVTVIKPTGSTRVVFGFCAALAIHILAITYWLLYFWRRHLVNMKEHAH